jgi:thioredoxin reductase
VAATTVDAVVVGGGPAGLSAAGWLGRYRRSVLIVDSEEYRNAAVELAHGYLGCDPAPPADLRQRGAEEVLRYPTVTLEYGRVESIAATPDGFIAELSAASGSQLSNERREVAARRVVLATGVRDRFPELDGFFEHYGADVFHCASCDGYEAKGRDVVVLGWGGHVPGFAIGLLTWAKTITVVTDGHDLEAATHDRRGLVDHGVQIIEDDAVGLIGRRHHLEGVRLASGTTVACDLAFFSIGHEPNNGLAAALGADLTDEGCVVADRDGVTSVPGLFAAGDLTPGVQLIANAVAKGASAGIACAQSLVD